MNTEQFKMLMNIVHLEGQLKAISKQRKKAEKSVEPHRYDLDYFHIEKTIHEITQGVPSDIFIRGLLSETLDS